MLDPTDVGVLNQTVLSAQALMNRAPEAARQASSLVEAAAVAARPLLYSCLTAPPEGSETTATGADADADADAGANTPATSESISSHVTLGSGHPMPRLGFGTCWIAGGEDVYRATREALRAGYRHIDGTVSHPQFRPKLERSDDPSLIQHRRRISAAAAAPEHQPAAPSIFPSSSFSSPWLP